MRTNFVTAMSIVLSCMAFSSCAQTTTFSIGGKTTETITIDKNDKIVTRQFNVRNFDGISTSSVIEVLFQPSLHFSMVCSLRLVCLFIPLGVTL